MFHGNNTSGKEFDVIDEDGDVLGSFDLVGDAQACAKSAPWYAGAVRIRRDFRLAQERSRQALRDHHARCWANRVAADAIWGV